MDQIPASIPFHVARAYGLGTRPATQVEAKPTAQAKAASDKLSTLIAANVPGSVRFGATTDTFTPTKPVAPTAASAEPFQLYRHPADKNAAATAINAGRSIDLKG